MEQIQSQRANQKIVDTWSGLGLGLGIAGLWAVSDAVLLWSIWERKSFKHNVIITSIASIIAVSAIWSPNPIAALMMAVRILMVYSVVMNVESRRIVIGGLSIVLLAQLGGAIWQFYTTDRLRIDSFSRNAVAMGSGGFAAVGLVPWFTTPLIGLSQSRTLLLGLALWWYVRPSWARFWMVVAATVIALVISTNLDGGHGLKRLTSTSRITSDFNLRIGTLKGDETARVASVKSVKPVEPAPTGSGSDTSLYNRWLGAGYGGYNTTTGLQLPHNTFSAVWVELGLLSIPLVYLMLIGYGSMWQSRRLLIALAPSLMLGAEWFTGAQAPVLWAVWFLGSPSAAISPDRDPAAA